MRGATARNDELERHVDAFQSTRPMRGATRKTSSTVLMFSDFNPRAPCGARLVNADGTTIPVAISIHAPHAGRDEIKQVAHPSDHDFNPRAPCGARPRGIDLKSRLEYFNPRAPCGARRSCTTSSRGRGNFNPRAPCGARRETRDHQLPRRVISIHAPHAGRDYMLIEHSFHTNTFQSTRPMRGATRKQYTIGEIADISIHAPHAGRDRAFLPAI